MPQFGLLAFPVFIAMSLLSGGQTPLESMPIALQRFMQVVPSTHFRQLFPGGAVQGCGLQHGVAGPGQDAAHRSGLHDLHAYPIPQNVDRQFSKRVAREYSPFFRFKGSRNSRGSRRGPRSRRLHRWTAYKAPEITPTAQFKSQVGASDAKSVADLPWWQVFNDKALQGLVTQALANNFDLQGGSLARRAGPGPGGGRQGGSLSAGGLWGERLTPTGICSAGDDQEYHLQLHWHRPGCGVGNWTCGDGSAIRPNPHVKVFSPRRMSAAV